MKFMLTDRNSPEYDDDGEPRTVTFTGEETDEEIVGKICEFYDGDIPEEKIDQMYEFAEIANGRYSNPFGTFRQAEEFAFNFFDLDMTLL